MPAVENSALNVQTGWSATLSATTIFAVVCAGISR